MLHLSFKLQVWVFIFFIIVAGLNEITGGGGYEDKT
jgi:hypothetical protein